MDKRGLTYNLLKDKLMYRFYKRSPFPGKEAFSPQAFSLIEIVAVTAIVAILAGTIVPMTFQKLTSKRGKITEDRLKEFKRAMIGNPFVIDDEVRTYFGYLGDMGNLPASGSLTDLYARGTQPTYSYNPNLRTGAGWQGPYLDPAILEDLATLELDGYRQGVVYTRYDPGTFTEPQTGAEAVGQLTSIGPDRVQGTTDDWNMYIYRSEALSTVSGYLKDATGNRMPGIRVTMNYPTNGSLATLPFTTTDSTGYFSFSNVPFGNRSITAEPKLVTAPGSYKAFDEDGDGITNDVELYITNLYYQDITIEAVIVYFDFSVNPSANFQELYLWSSADGQRKEGQVIGGGQSGQEVRFTTPQRRVTVAGSGGSASGQSYLIRVQSPQTHIPELNVRNYPVGATIRMEIRDFRSGNKRLNMRGLPLRIEFYDTWSGNSGTLNSTIFIPSIE